MSERSQLTRWVLPSAVSLLALSLLRQRSEDPVALGRYGWDVVLLFVLLVALAAVTWWIAVNAARFGRLQARLRSVHIGGPLTLLVCAVVLLDIATPIVESVAASFRGQLLTVIGVGIVGLIALLGVAAAERPGLAGRRIALLLASTTVAVLGLEAVFRVFMVEPHVPRSRRAFEEKIAATWPRPVPVAKPKSTLRIVGLSDSFGTNGGSSNYHYRLEEALRGDGVSCEVVNLSRGAYELPEERELFYRHGRRYRPDVLLHGVFVGNDFWGDPSTELLSYGEIPVRRQRGIGSWLPRNFLVREWLPKWVKALRNRREQHEEAPNGEAAVGFMSREEFLRVERMRLDICHRSLWPKGAVWDRAVSLLDQIHREAARIGARSVIVIHPDQFQVEHALFREIVVTYQLNPALYDLQQPQRFLHEYCRANGLLCVDLLPVFREHGAEGGLYLLRDTHYNERGNRLAAETIHGSFLRHGVVR